jgi:alkylated DNA repair protein (DNA oxidative demethylase)
VAGSPRLFPDPPVVVAPGAVHLPGWLDVGDQRRLVGSCRAWVAGAGGMRSPRVRGGVMSVQIACLGWHWYPYRYSRTVDDDDGRPVAPFPDELAELSRRAVADASDLDTAVLGPPDRTGGGVPGYRPDVALINWYGPGARMGMHADRDERSPAPVVSLSLGDSCVFRFGTPAGRSRPWTEVLLHSGDLFVFGGPARLAFHGVTRVLAGTADPAVGIDAGRFNITVRQSGLEASGPTARG